MSDREISEAQQQLLRELPARFPVSRIERIWLFGPREIHGRESGLVVLSLLSPDDPRDGLRQVVTWRYEAERVRGRLQRSDTVAEEGWAPADRIPRVIEGVLRRLGNATENPIAGTVSGSEDHWWAFLHSVGVSRVDSASGEGVLLGWTAGSGHAVLAP